MRTPLCLTILAGATALGLAATATAQPVSSPGSREDTLDSLVRRLQICGETQEATRRLDCYDAVARTLGTRPVGSLGSTAPAPSGPAVMPPPAAAAPAPSGGYVGNVTAPDDPDRAFNPNDPNDQRGHVAADPYPPPPQPQPRRTGPGPLPADYQRMPIVTLNTSQFGYNEQRYWQVTVDVANNIPQLIDTEVGCTFTNAGRPVKETRFTATAVQPGEHVMTEVIGPPTTTYVDGVTCHVINPLR